MGITSSSNSRIKQAKAYIVGEDLRYSVENSGIELMKKEYEALFGPKPEENFTDVKTETYDRLAELMRGRPCKELYRVMGDCRDENGFGSKKCGEHALKVFDCMCSHPDYQQRMLAVMKSIEEHVAKEHGAYVARKQAFRDCLRGTKLSGVN